ASASGTITFVDPNDPDNCGCDNTGAVTITNLTNDAVITAPTNIVGSISDSDGVASWTVKVVSFDGTPTRTIASGTSAVSGTLATFDPTVLANGSYTIVVSETNLIGESAGASVRVQVEGNLKLGHETLSVTDLTIPVSGIPITITRSYDSLLVGKPGDFGYGWKLSFGDVQLETD